MRKLSHIMQRISNLRTLFLLFAFVVLMIIVPDFIKTPISPLKFEEYSKGLKMLDMTINYSPEEAYNLIENYGKQAIEYYLYVMEPIDVLIPAIMGLFLCVIYTITLRNMVTNKYITYAYIFPILGCVFDYMENVGVITMLTNYPSKLVLVARITNFFTMAKSIFVTVSILIACFSTLVKVFSKLKIETILSWISIILFPFTILFFLFPVFVYFVPLLQIRFVISLTRILLVIWIVIFLFSLTFLSSYCGFLCPITKLFTLLARKLKNSNILKHQFPKVVGFVTRALWLASAFYVYLRVIGNQFGFLSEERIFSRVEIIILISFYCFAAILLNTNIGKDELGHYLCPLSPFIKLGISINQLFKIPGYRIVPDSSHCVSCGQCNKICTYGNNVMDMIKRSEIDYKRCSNCGECISVCKNKAIKRKWTKY